MLFIGIVNNSYETSSPNNGRIQVKINPITDGLADSDLPWVRPLLKDSAEYNNLLKNDLVYLYTEDELFNEVYYLGKISSQLDIDSLLSNVSAINQTILDDMQQSNKIKALKEYSLNDGKIKILSYGTQLQFINGIDGFTLIADRTSGNCFYLDGNSITTMSGKSYIKLSNGVVKVSCGEGGSQSMITMDSSGEIKIYAGESNILWLLGQTVSIGGDNIVVGGSEGYIVTSPIPGGSTVVNGMAIKASSKVQGG